MELSVTLTFDLASSDIPSLCGTGERICLMPAWQAPCLLHCNSSLYPGDNYIRNRQLFGSSFAVAKLWGLLSHMPHSGKGRTFSSVT